MMSTCLLEIELRACRRPASGTAIGSRHGRELLLEQLEVNRHRVQRILHFVRDARHQPTERGQLARVVQRRVHLAQESEVARDEHRAEEAAARVLDRMAHQQPLGRLRIGFSRAGSAQSTPAPAIAGRPAYARRAAARGCRPAAVSTGSETGAGASTAATPPIEELEKISSPSRREQRHRVLEVVHHRLEVGGRRRQLLSSAPRRAAR